jgi:hypothetical protein|tara:strand:- start:1387 stop:1698 length:312 start_codon:yes stop_codon:yes gene_type:complete
MPDNVTITVGAGDTTNISVSDATSAAQTSFDATTSDLTSTDLQTAVASLANEKFAQDGTPSGASEGAMWYDTDDDILYVRRNSSWTKLIQENLDGGIDGGSYT